MRRSLSKIEFENEFISNFPGDDSGSTTPRQTPGVLYSKAPPTPVSNPALLAWSEELAAELNLERPASPEEIAILSGNLVTSSMYPYAACYAGHQFGHWAGQLGDGRAITLGELPLSDGSSRELQLKGAGRTAYSRSADGRAVLRSSVREYLMSEAMHHLGVPTTRALSLVSTGDEVLRDMFYDGNAAYEPGAIVMRVAPSFLRFGNFEMLAARQETEHLRKLTNWSIDRYYPHLSGDDRILQWFQEVVNKTAHLMVEWMRVGFVHGVMNTDNMSILGLTIDYGPYSFVDDYDLNFTPNTTDLPGRRYAFGRQASIAQWNLGCLGGALAPLFDSTEELVAILKSYEPRFWNGYYEMMSKKLGLDNQKDGDQDLINELDNLLNVLKPDMTIFIQLLIHVPRSQMNIEQTLSHFTESFYQEPAQQAKELLHRFMTSYVSRLESNSISTEASQQLMRSTSPRFILRNYLLHQAIEELNKGEQALFLKLQNAIKQPYSDAWDEFFAKRPDWAGNQPGCSMLSCSS